MREPAADPAGDSALRADLVQQARRQYAEGDLVAAWQSVSRVAQLSRLANDTATLADAATVIRPLHNLPLMSRVHDLCAEALDRIGSTDPVRLARLQAQLVATSDPFGPERIVLAPETAADDPEAAFLQLRARQAELLNPRYLGERLVLADAALELGRTCRSEEYSCWGRRWRMDVYAILGARLDLAAEALALTPVVERLDQPVWRAYLLQTTASARLLEGRFDEAAELSGRAATIGGPESEASFLDLVFRSTTARLTGEDAGGVADQVRGFVDDLPYLARGWLAQQLIAADRRDEAEWEWKALVPHLKRVPDQAAELLIALVGNAELCTAFGDAESASVLHDQLLPYAGLQAIGLSCGPHEGPVSLALGMVSALLGRVEEARAQLGSALRSCEEQRALPYAALAHAALASTYDAGSRIGRDHAERATALARRFAMRPLLVDLAERRYPSGTTLTRRELEISALVAEGLSNAAIASNLVLSERTVENHVSHILQKLDLSSRAAVASWHTRVGGSSA